jgi:hypothetical protein
VSSLEKFQRRLVDGLSAYLQREIPARKQEIIDQLRAQVESGAPRRPLGAPPTRREQFLATLRELTIEVVDSIEGLRDVHRYLHAFPAESDSAARIRYLKYHLEHRLHELFILRDRLLRLAKRLERSYKRDPRAGVVAETTRQIGTAVSEAFRGPTAVRHEHVHEARFKDPRIDAIEFFHAASIDSPNPEFTELLAQVLEGERVRWRQTLAQELDALDHALEVVFKAACTLVFAEDGTPIFPANLPAA